MLYAYNTFYKLKTPMKLVFNKSENNDDVNVIKKYLRNDLDFYQELESDEYTQDYYNNLLSLVQDSIVSKLDKFKPVFISAKESIGLEYL